MHLDDDDLLLVRLALEGELERAQLDPDPDPDPDDELLERELVDLVTRIVAHLDRDACHCDPNLVARGYHRVECVQSGRHESAEIRT